MSVACSTDILRSNPADVFDEHSIHAFLLKSQNPNGGWGFRANSDSAVEPTCWALMALGGRQADGPKRTAGAESEESVQRGLRWLTERQRADGSWPMFEIQDAGCWATSVACLALSSCNHAPEAVARGRDWLCNSWPAEGSAWRRLAGRFRTGNSVVRQDTSLRGWSWTEGAASWVEPTSVAILALRSAMNEMPPEREAQRVRLGERMLYDRMCPSGGWNSGNPLVYGVEGIPRIGPTVWALLALRQYASRRENQISLDWLRESYSRIRGAVSLSLAHICLTAYGISAPPVQPALAKMHSAQAIP